MSFEHSDAGRACLRLISKLIDTDGVEKVRTHLRTLVENIYQQLPSGDYGRGDVRRMVERELQEADPPRRWRAFPIGQRFLLDLLKKLPRTTFEAGERFAVPTIETELPADARLVSMDVDFRRGCLMVIVESESFDPVPLGEEIPCESAGRWIVVGSTPLEAT